MTKPPFAIRRAAPADYEALCALWKALDDEHRRRHPDVFREPPGPARERDWVEALISDPGNGAFVAEAEDGAIVGFAVVVTRVPPDAPVLQPHPYAELDNIVVAPSRRRLGVGRVLVEAARAWTVERRLHRLQLQVYEFNTDAVRFYEALGFLPFTRRLALPV